MTICSNMGIEKQINKQLRTLKTQGYAQVSLSELAWHTGLENDAILPSLAKAGIETVTRNGEIFVLIVEPRVHFSDLDKPKSAILGDLTK